MINDIKKFPKYYLVEVKESNYKALTKEEIKELGFHNVNVICKLVPWQVSGPTGTIGLTDSPGSVYKNKKI